MLFDVVEFAKQFVTIVVPYLIVFRTITWLVRNFIKRV